MLRHTTPAFLLGLTLLIGASGCAAANARIPLAEYQDKVYASWLAQCIGNMYGLPHEFKYKEEPRTEPIPGWMPETLEQMRKHNGAFSDDDTDIEYVMLHCMEAHGPEPTYVQVADFWKRCINDYIWVANRAARDLMSVGYLPPLTGRKGLNEHWYQIDPQLVCEIWSVISPGMIDYAAAKADWAARVTNDDYGTHPTIWYNTMYAAAFFEKDVDRLCEIGYQHVPAGSIFRTAIDDVRNWKKEHGDDWVAVRKQIKLKYHDKQDLPQDIATGEVSALLNGTLGVLALLYGQGDFEKTMNFACMAGYDADNQCATLAGLVGIMHGSEAIPRQYLYPLEQWTKPLNDLYKNRTRDDLPDAKITEIADRTAAMGRKLVLQHGGRVEGKPGEEVLVIPRDAAFVAPLETRLYPIHLEVGQQVTVKPEIVGGPARGYAGDVILAGVFPPGLEVKRESGGRVLTGTPQQTGEYTLVAVLNTDGKPSEQKLTLHVHRRNLARIATKILAAVTQPTGTGSRDLEVLRNGMQTGAHYDSYDGENALAEDYYGYEWSKPTRISRVEFTAGPVFPNGGWFQSVDVQYRDADGQWKSVHSLIINPPFTEQAARQGKLRFTFTFRAVESTAIRLIGPPAGTAQFTSISEFAVHR